MNLRGDASKAGSPTPMRAAPSLALVQHGHQYLITDGYDNREGISEILQGFRTVLALHLKYNVVLNLHLSGTLMEAIAWHDPEFFGWVRALHGEGLLEVLGSTYSQNIMPLSSPEQNLRQMRECLWLCHKHLGVDPEQIKGFWVPERVWSTAALVPLLRSGDLPNGGYDYVLLDDRFAYPVSSDTGPERHAFDIEAAPLLGCHPLASGISPTLEDHLRPWVIEGGEGLVAVPISSALRYCIPPHRPAQMEGLVATVEGAARRGPDAIAVYADDLEKSCGLGPWTGRTWTRPEVDAYERVLEWVAGSGGPTATLLSPWLGSHSPSRTRRVDPGTFFELAHHMGAGEEYRAWWEDPAWEPYRAVLQQAEALLEELPPGPAGGLRELGWKQLIAAFYETAWHEVEEDGVCRPAPWARALASHARSVFVVAAAAAWQARVANGAPLASQDGSLAVDTFEVNIADVDHDGQEEVVLANGSVFAVLSPRRGGRLVYLFHLAAGGRLVIGNPADDWNWQEEANQYMRIPRNHPGAFTDVGHENDAYRIDQACSGRDGAYVVMTNEEPGSSIAGAVKTFRLPPHAELLEISYLLPETPERFLVDFALSPDYLSLLSAGRSGIRALGGNGTRGWRCGQVSVWVRLPEDQPVLWEQPSRRECGHGLLLRVAAWRSVFTLELGLTAQPASTRRMPAVPVFGWSESRRLTLVPLDRAEGTSASDVGRKGAR